PHALPLFPTRRSSDLAGIAAATPIAPHTSRIISATTLVRGGDTSVADDSPRRKITGTMEAPFGAGHRLRYFRCSSATISSREKRSEEHTSELQSLTNL